MLILQEDARQGCHFESDDLKMKGHHHFHLPGKINQSII
jgi:hypothetical protein